MLTHRTRHLWPIAAATSFLLIAGAACGERAEPTGAAETLYPVTVASAGDRPLVVPRPARRIAVLADGPGEIVRALGAGRRIAGNPVEPNGNISMMKVKRLKPDLILASADSDERQLSRAAAATRAAVYVAPGNSIHDVEQAITELGLITGRPVAARQLVHAIEADRRLVARKLRRVTWKSVFVDTGFFATVSDRSLIGELIAAAHGRNVAGRTPEPGPFDLRELVALDPDVYIALSDSGTTLAGLRKNGRTRKLRAVREGRVVIIDAELLQPGPRAGDGLLAIARALHPNAFR